MDMFAIHPYLIPSRLPPTFAHPQHDDDRRRRLPEARQAADDRVPRHGAARRDAADRLRRVRLPVEDPAAQQFVYTPPRREGRAGRDPGVAAGEVLRAGVRARGVPADGGRDADLPRRRRARRARVAVGPLLRQRPAEDEPRRRFALRRSPRRRERSRSATRSKTTANVDDVVVQRAVGERARHAADRVHVQPAVHLPAADPRRDDGQAGRERRAARRSA